MSRKSRGTMVKGDVFAGEDTYSRVYERARINLGPVNQFGGHSFRMRVIKFPLLPPCFVL